MYIKDNVQKTSMTDLTQRTGEEESDINIKHFVRTRHLVGIEGIVGSEVTPQTKHLRKNNNQYLVLAGIITVLFTFYLAATGLHQNYETLSEQKKARLSINEKNAEGNEIIDNIFLDHQSICKKVEIFANPMNGVGTIEQLDTRNNYGNTEISQQQNDGHEDIFDGVKSHVIPGRKLNRNTNGKNNSRNGYKPTNKSLKEKNVKMTETNKKDSQTKRNSTAEPIIYLFALIFIYLLLKAASDINQHYKSQAKGDKRSRRCSLQSYAQTHRQDRRASKGIASRYLPKL